MSLAFALCSRGRGGRSRTRLHPYRMPVSLPPLAATWRRPEQSGRPLPAIEAATVATNGSGSKCGRSHPRRWYRPGRLGCAILASAVASSRNPRRDCPHLQSTRGSCPDMRRAGGLRHGFGLRLSLCAPGGQPSRCDTSAGRGRRGEAARWRSRRPVAVAGRGPGWPGRRRRRGCEPGGGPPASP